MHFTIINGPNLNLLGKREPEVYGAETMEDVLQRLRAAFPQSSVEYYQSNVEGELVNFIQQAGFISKGIVLNPGAYTHTSVAIGDAVAAITAPVIEVHISNVLAREEFRKISHVSAKCKGIISGLGTQGYELALRALGAV